MKTACFAQNHPQLLTRRSTNTTTSLWAAKTQFFIAASPKFKPKSGFSPVKMPVRRIKVSCCIDVHSLSKQKSKKKRQTSDKGGQFPTVLIGKPIQASQKKDKAIVSDK